MSTNDVPGAIASNNDDLHVGCWAEHDDGSLMLVIGCEEERVIYRMYDLLEKPIVAYDDAMDVEGFKQLFTWGTFKNKKIKDNKWTWHDKSAFPFDRVMGKGYKPGPKHASADDQISAAVRVAKSRNLRTGSPIDDRDIEDLEEQLNEAQSIMKKLNSVVSKFKKK